MQCCAIRFREGTDVQGGLGGAAAVVGAAPLSPRVEVYSLEGWHEP